MKKSKRIAVPEKSFIFLCRISMKELFLGPEPQDEDLDIFSDLFESVKFDISLKEKNILKEELKRYCFLNISKKKMVCVKKVVKILEMEESLKSFSVPLLSGVG